MRAGVTGEGAEMAGGGLMAGDVGLVRALHVGHGLEEEGADGVSVEGGL